MNEVVFSAVQNPITGTTADDALQLLKREVALLGTDSTSSPALRTLVTQ